MKNSFVAIACCLLVFASLSSFSQSPETYLEHLYDHSALFDTTRIVPSTAVADSSEWKLWRTVENFSYGKNRGSIPMIADLNALHPFFRDKIVELIRMCREAGITLAVVETYRTPSKQAEYFAMGNKYTSTPGGKSRHQYGLAVDVVPLVDSVAVWNNHKLWRKIGLVGERLGLRWGGRWRVLYDPGHFEWVGGLSRYELAKGMLPTIPASLSGKYPNLAEELAELQSYWQAWEVEQSVIANKGRDEETDVAGVGQ